MTARSVYSNAPESLQAAVAAALLGAGSRHLGSSEWCAQVLQEAVAGEETPDIDRIARQIVADHADRGARIPGIGHWTHAQGDPRADRLIEIAAETGTRGVYCELIYRVAELATEQHGRLLPVNVTGAITAIASDLGFRWQITRAFALIGRTLGALGHIQEEMDEPLADRLLTEIRGTIDYRPRQVSETSSTTVYTRVSRWRATSHAQCVTRNGENVILDQKVVIPAPPERVWELVMDVPAVATCVPGVESVEQVNDDEYIGALRVRVGKIAVRLEGKVTVVDRNRDTWSAGMNVEAVDRKIRGSVKAKSTMQLSLQENGSTELTVHADTSILGKLGEFGQAVMRRKADQIVGEFAQNVARKIEIETGVAEEAPTAAAAPSPPPRDDGAAGLDATPQGSWRAFFRRLRLRLRAAFRRA